MFPSSPSSSFVVVAPFPSSRRGSLVDTGRRLSVLTALPQVTKLMGHEPLTKWVVLGVVSLQITLAILLRHTRPLSPLFLLTAYVIGGTANHNLFLAIHEITHNLAFRRPNMNKALAVFANLPIGIPYSAAFKVRRCFLSNAETLR